MHLEEADARLEEADVRLEEVTGAGDSPLGPSRSDARSSPLAATPMMRQYLSVKSAHPGAIVFFRMGDFFETFYEDAVACAELLDITLTSRSKERDVPMAGVPHHAVDNYLARLVAAGRTVVMVDQVEDPRQAKGLVRREVTRILTPGTFIDSQASTRRPSYLASVAVGVDRRKEARFGLAVLELSTGEFRGTSGTDVELLVDEMARLGARELIVASCDRHHSIVERIEKDVSGLAVTVRPDSDFALSAAVLNLTEAFGADEMRGLRVALSDETIIAASAALRYAESTQIRPEAVDLVGRASLRHVETVRPYTLGDSLVLDREARAHLELFETPSGRDGSMIDAIDEAITPMGGRLLARWLAYPSRDPTTIGGRLDAIEALIGSPSMLDRIRDRQRAVFDLERLLGRIVMGRATPKDVGALRDTLRAAGPILALASQALTSDSAAPGHGRSSLELSGEVPTSVRLGALAATDPCEDVGRLIEGALVDEPSTDLESSEVFRSGFDERLDELRAMAENGKSTMASLETKEREATGIASLKVRYNRVFGYYIEVTKANVRLVPERYVRKQTTVNGERYFTEELKDLETKVLSAEDERIERTRHLFVELVDSIAASAHRLGLLARALAEIDVLTSLAHIAEARGWTRPTVDEGSTIDVVDGRHPVIDLRSSELGERFVPNDLLVDESDRLVIITGPNMAGKSTVMRQTALIVILAHMGSFVPARRARVGLVDRLFTRVGASDDLSRGRSTFMVEMHETARILRSATQRSLILLDEIGRGTSTFDGLSIAWAVAEYLHDTVRARTLFATHYHELTEICRDKPHASNRHVAVKEWNDQIIFLRKLMPGATNRSYGVQVARLAGLPKAVIERASEVLHALEAQDLSSGDESRIRHRVDGGRARGSTPEEQLHLFGRPVAPVALGDDDERVRAVLTELKALRLDDMTPRQALEKLGALQDMLADGLVALSDRPSCPRSE